MTFHRGFLRHWLFSLVFSCSLFAQEAVVYMVPETTAAQGAHLRDELIRAQEAFRKWKQQTELSVLNHGAVDFSYDFRFAVPHKEPVPVAVGPCSSDSGNSPLIVGKATRDPYAWDTEEKPVDNVSNDAIVDADISVGTLNYSGEPAAQNITTGTLTLTTTPSTVVVSQTRYSDGRIESRYADGRLEVIP